jgi:NADH-quinone oxidoreductase subunit J
MTLYSAIFYLLSVVIVAATTVAITRRNLVHAVIYLVFSFFGTSMLFYLLGAPLLAVLWVIIYAGAVMVLFLFIVMMVKVESPEEVLFPLKQWLPAAVFGGIYLVVGLLMVVATPGNERTLELVSATPKELALYAFQRHWLSVEVVSLLLLVALVGALYLGKRKGKSRAEDIP